MSGQTTTINFNKLAQKRKQQQQQQQATATAGGSAIESEIDEEKSDRDNDHELNDMIYHGEIILASSDSEASHPTRPKKPSRKRKSPASSSSSVSRYRLPPVDTSPVTDEDISAVRSMSFGNNDLEEGTGVQPISTKPMYNFRPCKMEEFILDEIDQEESSDNPTFCFLCAYGQAIEQAEFDTRLTNLITHVRNNLLRSTVNQWTLDIQEMYNDTLRQYTEERLPWYRQEIFNHFDWHAHYPALAPQFRLLMLRAQLRILRDGMIKEVDDERGIQRVDVKSGAYQLKLLKELRQAEKEVAQVTSNAVI